MKLLSDDSFAGKIKMRHFAKIQRIAEQCIANKHIASIFRSAAIALLCVLCLFAVGACGVVSGQFHTFEDAVEAGVIIDGDFVPSPEQQPIEYHLVSPVIQDLSRSMYFQAFPFLRVK
jgi:type 1 glutamine amidotransferase